MEPDDVAHARLANLQLSRPALRDPAEMVARLGAMQAQDFAGAKWSLGVRLWPATEAAIDRAFNDGDILRTHVLRPTWHFVTPDDIRWMLALTAPRVHATNGTMYRLLELDAGVLLRCAAVIDQALRGGRQLTRDELRDALEREGISIPGGPDRSGQRLAYIVMWAELEGLIVSGPRRDKQFTYMLLDERAPDGRRLARDEALAELTRRYFLSHGPATAHDFARWSSLTLADARQGLEASGPDLRQAQIEGQTYWFAGEMPPLCDPSPTAYLLSIYDEYTIGYKDRRAIGEGEYGERLRLMGNALQNVIILDGRIAGTWRRVSSKSSLAIDLNPFWPLSDAEREAIHLTAARCGEFFGVPINLAWHSD